MTKTNKLAKLDIKSNITAIVEEDTLPPELMKMLEDKVPAFVKEYAADGTAVMRWMHEYLILMEEVLRLDHGFTEDQLVQVEKRIKEMLPVIAQMKIEDTKLLRKIDFAIGMEMVERNKMAFKAEQSGIALPSKGQRHQLLDKKTNG